MSHRGVINAGPDRGRGARLQAHRAGQRVCNGVRPEFIQPAGGKKLVPIINLDGQSRFPVLGALWQPRRHRPPRRGGLGLRPRVLGHGHGHHPEMRGHRRAPRRRPRHRRRPAAAHRLRQAGSVVAGHSGVMAEHGRIPPADREPPCRRWSPSRSSPAWTCVVMANTVHGYMSQSDKGEMVIGGGADGYNNYTQRGPSTVSRRKSSAPCRDSSRSSRGSRCCASGAASWT